MIRPPPRRRAVIYTVLANVGGSSTIAIGLASLLMEQGLEVELALVVPGGRPESLPDPRDLERLSQAGIRVAAPPSPLWRLPFAQQLWHAARFVLAGGRPEIFLVIGMGRASAFLCRAIGARNSIYYFIIHDPRPRTLKRMRRLARVFSRLVFISPITEHAFRRHFGPEAGANVSTIVQFSEFKPRGEAPAPDATRQGRATALCLGRLYSGKGIRDLAELWPSRIGRDCDLHVFGDGPDRAAIEAIAARSSASAPRVTYRGRFAASDRDAALSRALDGADLVVVPTRGFWEGTPTVILEALCAGIPVVATDEGGTIVFSPEHFPDLPPGIVVCAWRDLFDRIRSVLDAAASGYDFKPAIRAFFQRHFSDAVLRRMWLDLFAVPAEAERSGALDLAPAPAGAMHDSPSATDLSQPCPQASLPPRS